MRTTLTLDDDVAADLRRIQRESRRSWKQVVNDVLRTGVAELEAGERELRRGQRTKSVRLGTPRIADISNVHEVLSLLDGDTRR